MADQSSTHHLNAALAEYPSSTRRPRAKKSRSSNLLTPKSPLLHELSGLGQAGQWGEMLAFDLAEYKAGRLPWDHIDPGCLLVGPPGTGKTTFAKALAATCGIPLVATSYAAWQRSKEGHLGDALSAMHGDFRAAVENAPCILFVDELDSLPRRAQGGQINQYMNAVVNAFLEEVDGIEGRQGVIVVGACNNADGIDPAVLRSGRLDRVITLSLPSLSELERIFRYHLKKDADLVDDLASVAVLCAGSSAADVVRIVREAQRRARYERRPIHRGDLIDAVEAGNAALDPQIKWCVAYNEAGKAAARLRLATSSRLTASLLARSGTGDRPSLSPCTSRQQIENILTATLAGRATEETVFGFASSRAGGDGDSDLAFATSLAEIAITRLGLSTTQDLAWHGRDGQRPSWVADEVRLMLTAAYERARFLAGCERPLIDALAQELHFRHALTHEQILAIDHSLRQPIAPSPSIDDESIKPLKRPQPAQHRHCEK